MRIYRLLFGCFLAFWLILANTPVQAVEPLVVYDTFNGSFIEFFRGKPIDPNRWQQAGIAEGDIFDIAREIRWNRLHLLDRTYGDISQFGGRKNTAVRVKFPDPNAVRAIMIKGTVSGMELTGCGGSTDRVRALRASGFFFNTTSDGGLGPGSGAIDDVLASIQLETRGDFGDPPNVLRVIAVVSICLDPDCFSDALLRKEDLGEYHVGDRIRLLIQWDEENHQFIFQRDSEPEVIYSYPDELNKGAPGLPQKRLGVSNRVANCPEGPRPVASIEALINTVFVNESAAP